MKTIDMLFVTDRDRWRAWLKKNHVTSKGIWLIYYKKMTGKPCIPYEDSVEEALCFGWIDSIIQNIDDEKYARKFTPRINTLNWSASNIKRAGKMIKQGRMTKAGRSKMNKAAKPKEKLPVKPSEKKLVLPADLRQALKKDKNAREYFDRLAPTYKKQYVWWITNAKKKETRKKRIKEAIRLLARNEKLGLK